MTILTNYRQFDGVHWETGTVRNFMAYRGVTAPHTGKPFSEAFLMGVSGGAVMGYFSFAYTGYDPHVAILTRNTFNPLDRMLERLGVVQTVIQTTNPGKATANLVEVLESGLPPLVIADMCSLPYSAWDRSDGMWIMIPIVVYGYDEAADVVHIADRAKVPLTATTGDLAKARGVVKKDKYRLLTLEPPDPAKIVPAVQKGIWDCIKLYTEDPPKGARHNFGLAAFQHWAELLANPRPKMSWANQFPAGRAMYAGLTSAYSQIMIFGKDGAAERGMYADFLDEAAVLLKANGLRDAATEFRKSAVAWDALASALLPDSVAPLKEARELMLRQHTLFLEQGGASLAERLKINERLAELRNAVERDFPLDESGAAALREDIRGHVLAIHDIERQAVAAMQDAMG